MLFSPTNDCSQNKFNNRYWVPKEHLRTSFEMNLSFFLKRMYGWRHFRFYDMTITSIGQTSFFNNIKKWKKRKNKKRRVLTLFFIFFKIFLLSWYEIFVHIKFFNYCGSLPRFVYDTWVLRCIASDCESKGEDCQCNDHHHMQRRREKYTFLLQLNIYETFKFYSILFTL